MSELGGGLEDFQAVFESCYRPLYRFFYRRGFDPEDCRDLAQETFLRAFRARGSFRGDSSVSTWLYTIAANLFRNEIGRRKAGKRAADEVSYEAVGESIATGRGNLEPEPLRNLLHGENRSELRRRIDELPPQMRRCILLRIDQELSYAQIAVVLGLSKDTIKAHLFQARRRLTLMEGEP